MDRNFVTPSGRSVGIFYESLRPTRGHDSMTLDLHVASTATTGPAQVVIDAPELTAMAYQSAVGASLTPEVLDELVVVSVLQAVDQDPAIVGPSGGPYQVYIHADNVATIANPRRLTDREIRRWLARRVYDEYFRADLDVHVMFDSLDLRITGATAADLWRNAQVLGEEAYFRVDRPVGAPYSIRPTAKLVRDVEKYGSAREDVVSESDYTQALESHPLVTPYREEILLEYHRYAAATTRAEIASVFRAVAPVIESILRDVLREKGVERDLPTLGPMIGELTNRRIGDSSLYSQLNHVFKFARDLEEHGNSTREPVLRIACANAFELVPQILAL